MQNEGKTMEEQIDLQKKVESWLKKQGYPLEFRTAHILNSVGFHCLQGYYVPDAANEASREIDVLARMQANYFEHDSVFMNLIVECKYTRDHPWVVFVSGSSGMASSAHIAQLTSSKLGSAIACILAGDPIVENLELFKSECRGGFGGCSSLSDNKQERKDTFYSAIQSVAAKAILAKNEDDVKSNANSEFPPFGAGVYSDGCHRRQTIREF